MGDVKLSEKVSDALVAEINAIGADATIETPVRDVQYTPQAWTRQGHVD